MGNSLISLNLVYANNSRLKVFKLFYMRMPPPSETLCVCVCVMDFVRGDHPLLPSLIPGTYDLQGVNLMQQGEGMVKLGCIFAQGSQSQGCKVTLCRRNDNTCLSVSSNGTTTSRLRPGQYTIKKVGQIASNGQVTAINPEVLLLSDILVTQVSDTCQTPWIAFGMIFMYC